MLSTTDYDKLSPPFTIAEQACKDDSTIKFDQVASQISIEDLPKLYDYAGGIAIEYNAITILKHLISKGVYIARQVMRFVPVVTTEILDLLLETGWDINSRSSAVDQLPFLWHVIGRKDLVERGLKHSAHTSMRFLESTPQRQRLLRRTFLGCVLLVVYFLPTSFFAPMARLTVEGSYISQLSGRRTVRIAKEMRLNTRKTWPWLDIYWM